MFAWECNKTDETRDVEHKLGQYFEQVDAYRYNSASIRVRIIDSQFARMSRDARHDLVDIVMENLATLPETTMCDILMLLPLAPDELDRNDNQVFANVV